MTNAPLFLKKYFWDIDFEKLDPIKSPVYVIERILEMGDDKAIKWLFKEFSKNLIIKVVRTSRGLSSQTATLWSLILGINKKSIVCLQTPYLKMRQTHWPY